MAKTLHVNGSSGRAYIYNGTAAASSYDQTPTASQLGDLYFHSDLSYLKNTLTISGSVSHPIRTRSTNTDKKGTTYNVIQGSQSYTLGTHTMGTGTPMIAVIGDYQMPAGHFIQKVNESVRTVSLWITATTVVVHEKYVTFDDTLPAISQSYTAYLFDILSTGSGSTSISISPTSFEAGFGKLDTDNVYVRRQSTSPNLYLTHDRTADVEGGDVKIVLPDGTTAYTGSNYTGSFTGTGGEGVDI